MSVLHNLYNSKKTTPTTIEFFDIAGLVKGASKGEGLGNKFLGHIRQVEAIVHVVRCFEDDNVVHVDGKVDPVSDVETINLELIFSDLELLERRIQKTKKNLKGDKSLKKELDILEKLKAHLEGGNSARSLNLDDEESTFVKTLDLLSIKKIIYVANVSETEATTAENNNEMVITLRNFAQKENSEVIVISAKVEEEISRLDPEEKEMFLEELGIEQSGLNKLVKASYHLLNLISYLTAGPDEVRAWTVTNGTKAPQAAGKIHTDFEKGFIRAETITYDELVSCKGNLGTAREKGLLRSEEVHFLLHTVANDYHFFELLRVFMHHDIE